MSHEVILPRLSQDMAEGRVVEWLKQVGDEVAVGDPLVVIETDKAEMDVTAEEAGTLRRIIVQAGETAGVGATIGLVGGPDEELDVPAADRAATPLAPAAAAASPAEAPAAAAATGSLETTPVGRQPASPAARRVAKELGINLADVRGSGLGGLVSEADVRSRARSTPTASGTTGADTDGDTIVPMTAVRRRIAERMAASRNTAADVTTFVDVDMTEVAARRKALGVSYTAFVAWATAQSLKNHPTMNASLVGDSVVMKGSVHLGVAVAAGDALLVPVVRNADHMSVVEVSAEIDALAAKARERKLGPAELTGSTFTLTNSGSVGSLFSTPIINQPEVGILGMGRVADTPVVRDGQIVVRKVMYLSLSYDHRVVDGAPAVEFIAEVKRRLEQPDA